MTHEKMQVMNKEMKQMTKHQKVRVHIQVNMHVHETVTWSGTTQDNVHPHTINVSQQSQKSTWTHNKVLVLVNNCDYTNTALPGQPSHQWLATYVPPSSHVHVQYTTIVTSHKRLLDLLDVRVQLQYKHTHTPWYEQWGSNGDCRSRAAPHQHVL